MNTHVAILFRLDARMTESSFSPISLPKLRFFAKLHQGNVREHDLRDAIAILDPKRGRTQVGQDDAQRPPIIAVDRARSVEHGNAVLERQTRPCPNLPLHPSRDGQGQARGHQNHPSRLQDERLVQTGRQVESRRSCRGPYGSPGAWV